MTKAETLDCVEMKRRAQRPIAKALAGQSPEEQVETLHRLAAATPLWKSLVKARTQQRSRSARTPSNRRSAG